MGLLRATSAKLAPSGRGATLAGQLSAGTYVTDERRLFRVVRWLAADRDERDRRDERDERQQRLLELEDCRTLELVLCPSAALARAGLRRVVPTLGA
jgi:hypothetical protein